MPCQPAIHKHVFWVAIAMLLAVGGARAQTMEGVWSGSYTCDARQHAMTLTIRQDRARLTGEFQFDTAGRRGGYAVSGSIRRNGGFHLDPGRWIDDPGSMRRVPLRGSLTANSGRIEGRLGCRKGAFHAQRTGNAPPAAPLAQNRRDRPAKASREEDWVASVRTQIAALAKAADTSNAQWRQVEHEIIFRAPFGTKVERKKQMQAELDAARAGVEADGLLAQLVTEPGKPWNAQIGRALWVADNARTNRRWPAAQKERVVAAARERAADVLRGELGTVAALADTLPPTLEGLKTARQALEPLEHYRHSLERAFGTIDPANVLQPLLRRLAAIEAEPTLALELRQALAQTRRGNDPIVATENLLLQALGPQPNRALAPIIAEARDLALVAAIVVEDQSGSPADPREPSAWNIAAAIHTQARDINELVAGLQARCRTGKFSNVFDATACIPFLGLDLVGGMQARVVRVAKRGCEVEKPGEQFLCSFVQDIRIHSATGGPLAPDLTAVLIDTVMPGYRGELSRARFRRSGTAGGERWEMERTYKSVAQSNQGAPLICPDGEYDAGGFCFPFDASGQ